MSDRQEFGVHTGFAYCEGCQNLVPGRKKDVMRCAKKVALEFTTPDGGVAPACDDMGWRRAESPYGPCATFMPFPIPERPKVGRPTPHPFLRILDGKEERRA